MTFVRLLPRLALGTALTLAAAFVSPTHAGTATDHLRAFDQTTYSGAFEAVVDLYNAPHKNGKIDPPARYRAHVLFERPDRFRLVLRPGEKNEFRAVSEAGIVRWRDLYTGFSGKQEIQNIVDPLAIALLGTAGELLKNTRVDELPLPKGGDVIGASFSPIAGPGEFIRGFAWFSPDGRPIAFEFVKQDEARVFVTVSSFAQNVQTKPSDFEL